MTLRAEQAVLAKTQSGDTPLRSASFYKNGSAATEFYKMGLQVLKFHFSTPEYKKAFLCVFARHFTA